MSTALMSGLDELDTERALLVESLPRSQWIIFNLQRTYLQGNWIVRNCEAVMQPGDGGTEEEYGEQCCEK